MKENTVMKLGWALPNLQHIWENNMIWKYDEISVFFVNTYYRVLHNDCLGKKDCFSQVKFHCEFNINMFKWSSKDEQQLYFCRNDKLTVVFVQHTCKIG